MYVCHHYWASIVFVMMIIIVGDILNHQCFPSRICSSGSSSIFPCLPCQRQTGMPPGRREFMPTSQLSHGLSPPALSFAWSSSPSSPYSSFCYSFYPSTFSFPFKPFYSSHFPARRSAISQICFILNIMT